MNCLGQVVKRHFLKAIINVKMLEMLSEFYPRLVVLNGIISMHTTKTRLKGPEFKKLQPEISQPILSKNRFVKQIWPLTLFHMGGGGGGGLAEPRNLVTFPKI